MAPPNLMGTPDLMGLPKRNTPEKNKRQIARFFLPRTHKSHENQGAHSLFEFRAHILHILKNIQIFIQTKRVKKIVAGPT